jgi:hypothetical protein
MKLNKKLREMKFLKFIQNLVSILLVIVADYILNQYNEINNFYIQKKENYSDLKKLNNQLLEMNQFDLNTNKEFKELSRKVEYEEQMIMALEPNPEMAEYYWWILIGMCWFFILSNWLIKKYQKPEKNTK